MYIVHSKYPVYKLSSTGPASFKLERVDFNWQHFRDENIDEDKKLTVYATIVEHKAYLDYPEGSQVEWMGTIYESVKDISYRQNPKLDDTYYWKVVTLTKLNKGSLVNMKSEGFEFEFTDVGKYYMLKTPREDNSISEKLDTAGQTTTEIHSVGSWNMVTHGIWDGTIEVQRTLDGGATWTMVRTYSATDDRNVDVNGEEEEVGAVYRVQLTVRNSGKVTVDFNLDEAYYENIYRAVRRDGPNDMRVQIVDDISHETTTLWADSSWGGDYTYPATITMHEQRLWFGGNDNEPLTIWSSKTGDYESLKTGVKDDDALSLTLSSTHLYRIKWMTSSNRLLVGTSGNEFAIGASRSYEAITPTNMYARVQSTNGSKAIMPVNISGRVMYVQSGGEKLFEMVYDDRSESFVSTDVTSFAREITYGEGKLRRMHTQYGIVDMAFQNKPYPILWCLRADGVLLGFTYEVSQKVYAWHYHTFELGIQSIAVKPEGHTDELWLLNAMSIIRMMDSRIPDSLSNSWFVDFGMSDENTYMDVFSVTNENPLTLDMGNSFSNGDKVRLSMYDNSNTEPPYLEVYTVSDATSSSIMLKTEDGVDYYDATGETALWEAGQLQKVSKVVNYIIPNVPVSVIGDDKYLGEYVSGGGGDVYLDEYIGKVLVGIPYESILKPMNMESQLADGSSVPRKKRITQVVVQFYNTIGGTIQDDDGNDMIIPFRVSHDNMNETPPMFTGQKKVKFKHGYDVDAGITILQDTPLPMTILFISAWIRTYN
jgi:hypothetical protein